MTPSLSKIVWPQVWPQVWLTVSTIWGLFRNCGVMKLVT